jgi:hypothetical protein
MEPGHHAIYLEFGPVGARSLTRYERSFPWCRGGGALVVSRPGSCPADDGYDLPSRACGRVVLNPPAQQASCLVVRRPWHVR